MRQSLDLVNKLLEADPEPPRKSTGAFRDYLSKFAPAHVVPEAYHDVLDNAPDEFKRAFEAGDSADWDMTDFMYTDNWPTYDDDLDEEGRNPWSERFYYFNYHTEGRKIYLRCMEGTLDGDEHSEVGEAEVGTPEAEAMEREYGSEGHNLATRRYWEWVIERGEDPLHYIRLPVVKTTKQWLAGFVRGEGKLKLWGMRQILETPPSPQPVLWPDVVKKAAKNKEWSDALAYLLLDKDGYLDMTEEELVAALDPKDVKVDNKNRLVVTYKIETSRVKSNRAYIIKTAKRALRHLQGLNP